MGDFFTIGLLGVLALFLLSAGIEDVRTREIANWKTAAVALLAPMWWWAIGLTLWPGVAIQIGVAAIVFALFVGAFAIGAMGGGDVKLIGAIALWLPPMPLLTMLIVMSLVGGAITLTMLAESRLRGREGAIEVPYGVAIAIAALLAIREPILNQFA
ncbi:prepilin peptidase [Sphingomonas floccifaciens]|uniref:Prepilin peptidase n=1 Tax=Sphingomonas floccifaciens TaxID=1844115 RepID=A0ABW4NC21_9SPHN